MSKSAQTFDGDGEKPIDQTLHSLALELADPPLADYRAFCAVVDECASATEYAVMGTRR